MSLRPGLRPALRPLMRATQARAVPRRGAHGGSSEHDTVETFFNPTWAKTMLVLAAAILAYPYLPERTTKPASPSTLSHNALVAESQDESLPRITRLIAGQMADSADTWSKRNDKHLELTREAADQRLLFQEAERPKILRMRYPAAFDMASPHAIGVGSQADLSDLKVKED